MAEAPFYHSYFVRGGRELVAEERDPNLFSLPGSEIVERVLAAGLHVGSRRRQAHGPGTARGSVREGVRAVPTLPTDAFLYPRYPP